MRRWPSILALLAVAWALVNPVPAAARVGWSDWLTASTYHTEHFRVLYQSDETTLAYAEAVGDYIEEARTAIFGRLGFAEPSWLEGYKLDVYITDIPIDDELGSRPLGVTYQNLRRLDQLSGRRIVANPWIEIGLESRVLGDSENALWREHYLKALVAHEFFHVVQFGYDVNERPWLMESTATWVEDKAFDVPESQWLSAGWAERFSEWSANRREMSTLSSKDTNEYAASAFFQYLSERRPGDLAIVRRIWEEAAKRSGHNTYDAIGKALGDGYAFGPKMQGRIADFAVATLIQSPSLNATYSFRKLEAEKDGYLDGTFPWISAEDKHRLEGSTLGSLTGTRIAPKTFSLKPFQVGYYEVLPPTSAPSRLKDLADDSLVGPLTVMVRDWAQDDWDFRLVEIPRREAGDSGVVQQWTVRRFPDQPLKDLWSRLVVEDFPRKRVILVAVNTKPVEPDEEIGPGKPIRTLTAADFQVAAALMAPPVVKRLEVLLHEDWDSWRTVWKLVREPSSRPGVMRTRVPISEGLRYDPNKRQRVKLVVELNRPIAGKPVPTLTVGGQSFDMYPEFDQKPVFGADFSASYYKVFKVDADIGVFREAIRRLESGENAVEMRLAMTGRDPYGARFDEKPDTAAHITFTDDDQPSIAGWEGDGTGLGGRDTLSGRKLPIHQIDPSSYLLSLEAKQGAETIYKAHWSADPSHQGRRQLNVDVSEPYDPERALDVVLTFAEPVLDVTLRLAGASRRYYPEGYVAELGVQRSRGEAASGTPQSAESQGTESRGVGTGASEQPSDEGGEAVDTSDLKVRLGVDWKSGLSQGFDLPYDVAPGAAPGSAAKPAARTRYTHTIPPSAEIKAILEKDKKLTFYIDAQTENGLKIDADPRSAAYFDWSYDVWRLLEENTTYGGDYSAGGTDEWHKLNVAGQSIVLLLDASGSMADAGRMQAAKAGIIQAISELQATDEVALVVFRGCNDIRVEVPFTQDPEEIKKALQAVSPTGDTPLGDAIRFANAYLERAARFRARRLLTFSDGMTTCGSSAASAVAEMTTNDAADDTEEEKTEEKEDVPKETRWTVYRVGTDDSPFLANYWVEEIEYVEKDFEEDAKDQASLTLRRYPVSYVSSRGRIVWSINWSSRKHADRRSATGGGVPALRARADGLREGSMTKARVDAAVQALIGPGAEPLRRL
jgi:Mg-chelatase subunit ChlD